MDKKVDCYVDAKCYVQSFNSYKCYPMWTLLLVIYLTNFSL